MSQDPRHYFRQSTRLKNYDYSMSGAYFITICTKDEGDVFGMVVNGKTNLNNTGKILERVWINLPKQFENINLDEFVVMPDHIHGIIIIKNEDFAKKTEGL